MFKRQKRFNNHLYWIIIMRKLLKYKFSSNKLGASSNKNILSEIKINFKQNQAQTMNEIVSLVQRRQWSVIHKMAKNSKLLTIDNWPLWTNLASVINKVSENVQLIKQGQLHLLLDAMRQLNYEVYQKSNPNLCNHIKKQLASEDPIKTIKIANRVLQTHPDFFINHKQKFEQKLLADIESTGNLQQENHYLFAGGLISQFWHPSFISQMQRFVKKENKKIYNLLCLQSQNLVQPIRKREKYSTSKTQTRMGLALADIGYIFDTSVEIDGTQVDFYIQSCKLVLEYNGIHHYRINSGQNRINYTKYMNWRKKCLLKKGFVVIEIPFYQWNKLFHEKSQKLYLIDKIQKYLLKEWVHFPDENKMQKIKKMQELTKLK